MCIGHSRPVQTWISPLRWRRELLLTMVARLTLMLIKNPTSQRLSWPTQTKLPLKNSCLMNMGACLTHKPSSKVRWRITCWCLKVILVSKHPLWWNSDPKLCKVSRKDLDLSITLLQNYIKSHNSILSRLLNNVKWTSAPIKLVSPLYHQTMKIFLYHHSIICQKEIAIFQWERKHHSKTIQQE